MTLVPIIYTSLIIFASLFFFIILASYIAFRAKSGNTLKPNIDEPQFAYIPRPAFVHSVPVRKESIQVPTRIIPQSNVSRSTSISYKAPETKFNTKTISNREITESRREENIISRRSSEQKYRTRQTERIEIMNNSEKFRRTSEFDNFHVQAGGTISDSNLLNYYSDQANIDFTVMNASYLRKAL
jgi:hypothetical protein